MTKSRAEISRALSPIKKLKALSENLDSFPNIEYFRKKRRSRLKYFLLHKIVINNSINLENVDLILEELAKPNNAKLRKYFCEAVAEIERRYAQNESNNNRPCYFGSELLKHILYRCDLDIFSDEELQNIFPMNNKVIEEKNNYFNWRAARPINIYHVFNAINFYAINPDERYKRIVKAAIFKVGDQSIFDFVKIYFAEVKYNFLHVAILHGSYEMTKLLLDCGADINCVDEYGIPAAASLGVKFDQSIADLLFSYSELDVNADGNRNILLNAVCNKHREYSRYLLTNQRVDVNVVHIKERTVLDLIIYQDDAELFELLLSRPDFSLDCLGESIFSIIINSSNIKFLEILKGKGFNFYDPNLIKVFSYYFRISTDQDKIKFLIDILGKDYVISAADENGLFLIDDIVLNENSDDVLASLVKEDKSEFADIFEFADEITPELTEFLRLLQYEVAPETILSSKSYQKVKDKTPHQEAMETYV